MNIMDILIIMIADIVVFILIIRAVDKYNYNPFNNYDACHHINNNYINHNSN